MLIVPQEELTRRHEDAKSGLTNQFNSQLERILNENSHRDVYWVLGKVRFPAEFEGKVGRVFLEASDSKPPLVKDAFLYEVDSRKGTKTLLWVMHPNNELALPTVGKTLRV
jgi:hypothetical protein